MKIVLDTNVLASGVFWGGTPQKILSLWAKGEFRVLASGLMQVTDQMVRIVGEFPNKKKWIECKNNLIHVTKEDKLDPVVSIALGTRILGHKYS